MEVCLKTGGEGDLKTDSNIIITQAGAGPGHQGKRNLLRDSFQQVAPSQGPTYSVPKPNLFRLIPLPSITKGISPAHRPTPVLHRVGRAAEQEGTL